MNTLENLLNEEQKRYRKGRLSYDSLTLRSESLKRELSALEEEREESKRSVEEVSLAYQTSIVREVQQAAQKLEQRNQVYQSIGTSNEEQEKKDAALLAIFQQYQDFPEILEPLREKYVEAKERKNAEQIIQEEVHAGIVLERIGGITHMYLSVPYEKQNLGLMENLTETVASLILKENLDCSVENYEGIPRVHIPGENHGLSEMLRESEPRDFAKAHVVYHVIELRSLDDFFLQGNLSVSKKRNPKKGSHLSEQEILRRRESISQRFTEEETLQIVLDIEHSSNQCLPRVESIQSAFSYLHEELGLKKSIFVKSSNLFNQDLEKMKRNYGYLSQTLQVGLKAIEAFPEVLGLSQENCQEKADFLLAEGFPLEVFQKKPQLLGYSMQKLRSQVRYLKETCGFDTALIVRYPQIMGYSIQKRLEPRRRALLEKNPSDPGGIKKLIPTFILTDERFSQQVMHWSSEEYLRYKETLFLQERMSLGEE